MVRLVAMVAVLVLVFAQTLRAQETSAEEDPLAKAVARNADRVSARLVDLVVGFGGPDGLTLAGIENHIAVERAGARASALRRLFAMDLDADGSVDRDELAVVQDAASAATRGRMERQFAAADADRDGTLDPAEIAADGLAAGLRALDEAEADLLRAAFRLDADGDGLLTVAEVETGVARLAQAG